MELKSVMRNYDLVFIGSGISCTHTLLAILDELKSKNPLKPLSILVIEKSPNFWTGIAFGPRSSKKALSITTLDEFVHPKIKNDFILWLKGNILSTILDLLKQDPQNQNWVELNKRKLEENQFEKLYFPRYLYGKYLEEKLKLEIHVLKNQGKLNLTLLQAEVINIYKIAEEYSLSTKNPGGMVSSIIASRLVLSMGHQGRKSVLPFHTFSGNNFIQDPYYPSMDQNLKNLKVKLEKPDLKPKNILIIGSNASALELIYVLKSDSSILETVDKIVVLSPSGELPYPIRENEKLSFPFPVLQELKDSGEYSADLLMRGILEELKGIKKSKINLGDIYYPFSDKVVSILKLLTETERKKFHDQHGMDFTRLIRRAGADYSGSIPKLKKKKQLEIMKGKIHDIKNTYIEKTKEEQYLVYYKRNEKVHLYPETFITLFNCSGFEGLKESQNTLIQNILSKNICQLNSSNRGFNVNDQLEGNKNLYIIGPLLGSLFIPSFQYWHVENAKRIYELSQKLAGHIVDSIPTYGPDKSIQKHAYHY